MCILPVAVAFTFLSKGESNILGLEAAGEVEEVGEGVKKWKVCGCSHIICIKTFTFFRKVIG